MPPAPCNLHLLYSCQEQEEAYTRSTGNLGAESICLMSLKEQGHSGLQTDEEDGGLILYALRSN